MRQASYSIKKLTEKSVNRGNWEREISLSEVKISLSEISLYSSSGEYVLPGALTKINVREEIIEGELKIILDIRTAKHIRVEKCLRKLLNGFNARYISGATNMRIGDSPPHYSDDDNCFIATEVYGREHPNLDVLRSFRDKQLSQSYFGREFIKRYYSGNGQRIARMVGRTNLSKRMIRRGLDVLVDSIKK